MSSSELGSSESGSVRGDPSISRRGMIKTVGAGAGVAAVGSGAVPHTDQLSPVQESEAIAPLAALGVGLAAGVVAGAAGTYVVGRITKDEESVDPEEIEKSLRQNEVHDIASTMDGQRSGQMRQTIQQDWVNANYDQTPFAKAAWAELEAAAAFEIVNGNSSEAQTAAFQALDRQATIAYWNAIEGHNRAIIGGDNDPGLIGGLVSGTDGGEATDDAGNYIGRKLGNFGVGGSHDLYSNYYNGVIAVTPSNVTDMDEWEPVKESEWIDPETSEGTGAYTVYKRTWNNPFMDPSKIDEIPVDEITIYGLPVRGSYNTDRVRIAAPWSEYYTDEGDGNKGTIQVNVGHPDREYVTPLDQTLYSRYLGKIDQAYREISNGVSDYVSNLDNALAEGVIEPSDIFSPSDAIDQFSNTSQQKQFAAQMVFNGIGAPSEEYSYEAKIKHPDLASESKWGQLFVSFASGVDNISVEPGTTIASADYRGAYFGFYREDTGEFQDRVLSGSSDLQILDVTETKDEEEYESDNSAGENGEATVWEGDDPPDPIQFPGDHPDHRIVVEGASGSKSSHPVSEIKGDADSNRWYLPSTSLSNGESIENIRIMKPPQLTESVQYISSPGSVTEETIKKRIESRSQLVETIESLQDESVLGGGFLDDFGLFGLGAMETLILVVVSIAGLNAASG